MEWWKEQTSEVSRLSTFVLINFRFEEFHWVVHRDQRQTLLSSIFLLFIATSFFISSCFPLSLSVFPANTQVPTVPLPPILTISLLRHCWHGIGQNLDVFSSILIGPRQPGVSLGLSGSLRFLKVQQDGWLKVSRDLSVSKRSLGTDGRCLCSLASRGFGLTVRKDARPAFPQDPLQQPRRQQERGNLYEGRKSKWTQKHLFLLYVPNSRHLTCSRLSFFFLISNHHIPLKTWSIVNDGLHLVLRGNFKQNFRSIKNTSRNELKAEIGM